MSGAKTAEDEDRIFEELLQAIPGDVDVQFEKTRTGFKVTVGPVGELENLAKRLTFGTITKTDPQARTIEMNMNR